MQHERLNGRIQRLLDARKRVTLKAAAIPAAVEEWERRAALPADDEDHADKLEAMARVSSLILRERTLTRKVAEYDQSLANIEKHGQETLPTGNPVSVEIDVPKGTFKITAHAPEA